MACLTAARSSGEVAAVAAIASGGEDRRRTVGTASAGTDTAIGIFAEYDARASTMPEGGMAAVAVLVLSARSARIGGRGRGSGMSPRGGAAMASPANRPQAATTNKSRMAVKSQNLPAQPLSWAGLPGCLFEDKIEQSANARTLGKAICPYHGKSGAREPAVRLRRRPAERGRSRRKGAFK